MNHPESYIEFEVYEDGTTLIGVASATLPSITFLTQSITGAGIGGTVEAVIAGMVDAMSLTLNFRSVTDSATKLMSPKRHLLDLRVAEQYWDSVNREKAVWADKYLMEVLPKTTNPGNVAPASAANASGEYAVYSYKATRDGEVLWDIDPFNLKCNVGGVDYLEAVRKALGRA